MNTPNFDLSPAHRSAIRAYAEAADTVKERTGRDYLPDGHRFYKRRYNCNASEVLRHHGDLCAALGVRPCSTGCNRAAARYNRGWFCAVCEPEEKG